MTRRLPDPICFRTLGYSSAASDDPSTNSGNFHHNLARCLLLLACAILSSAGFATDKPPSHARCNAPTEQEATLRYRDYRWFYDRNEMARKYAEIYASGKRLIDRARWNDDESSYELVYKSKRNRHSVPITPDFMDNIISHIERGLELNYFEHVFFPDMGHAHLLISQEFYEKTIAGIPPARQYDVYTEVLSHPDTRFLYHTAEQLRMIDDQHAVLPEKYLGWRYFTRNVVGRNDSLGLLDIHSDLETIGNTVCSISDKFRYWGAGFHLSASKDGCFSFTHEQQTYHFDISLSDLPSLPDEYGPLAGIDTNSSGNSSSASAGLWGAVACLP